MSDERWCGRCREQRQMVWHTDARFGARAEAAYCPRCGTRWGVRAIRLVPRAPVSATVAAQTR